MQNVTILEQSQNEQQALFDETLKKYSTLSSNDRGNNELSRYRSRNFKRKRTTFTDSQINFLKDLFKRIKYIDTDQANKIASVFGLSAEVITVWFQNRRARTKMKEQQQQQQQQQRSGEIHTSIPHSIDRILA